MNTLFATSASVNPRACRENFISRAVYFVRPAVAQIRAAAILAGALALLAPMAVLAQNNAVPVRVTDRVDTARLVTLPGNTHPLARAQYDQGAAPADLPMNRMMLVLKRSPDQETALQNLLAEQQTTTSANFHKWVTPTQFGQQFGPADADIQAVTSWLASYGFQSIKVSNGRAIIEFSGTAAQVQAGLHTTIHKYVVNGAAHWANSSDPQIPAALAPVVAGFVSLHNFPKKLSSNRSAQMANLTKNSDGKPQITFTDNSHGMAPADFNTIYNVGSSMTGSGVTVGVIARSNIVAQDVADFRSTFGLPGNNLNIILNGPDPGDFDPGGGEEAEAVLDATWPGAVAPAATVDLVVSETTNAAAGEDLSEFYIIDNNLADVMTESFSVCEAAFLPGNLIGPNGFVAAAYAGLAEQAAAQGITYLVASGDSGPDGCADPTMVQASGAGASVNLLAATPYTVAVGGTEFFNDSTTPSPYWSANNSVNLGSALSYIPEEAWNESCTVAQCGASLSGLWSSGGGQSAAFSKPSWQAGVAGIPTTNARFLPDVSLTAAGHDGYVLCIDASCEGNSPGFEILSGTSASVQAFGGVMALVKQKIGARLGIANFALYKLAATETLASCNGSNIPPALPPVLGTCIFNDTTTGNTNLTIVGETGFAAGVGYDRATGLGSVNVTNLVNKWSTAIADATTTTLTLNGGTTAVNITHGTSVSVAVEVAPVLPATVTPTGDVSLIANSSTDMGVDCFVLGGSTPCGTNSSTTTTILLPGGTYPVHAHYEGDGTFLGSDSAPVTVTVNPEPTQINFGVNLISPCVTVTSVQYGSNYVLEVDVADLKILSTPCNPQVTGSSPTGTVTLTDTVGTTTLPLDNGSFKLNSFGEFEDQTIQLIAGTHTVKASYLGDPSFSASGPATGVIVVSQATTTTSVAASPTTVSAGQNVTLTATVATQSNAIANSSQEPTGSVQFFVTVGSTTTSLGTVPVTGGVNGSTLFAQATAQLSSTTLASGQDKITAKYLGDNNYSASAVSPSINVSVGVAGVNVTPGCSSSTITISAPGQSGTCLITVTGVSGFSGAVALSCGLSTTPPSPTDVPGCALGAPDSNFTGSGSAGTITLSSTSETGTATITIGTTAASQLFGPMNRPHGPNWFLLSEIAAALVCLFLLSVTSRKRRGIVTFAAVVFMAMAIATGCGSSGGSGGGGGGGGNPGTTVGTYSYILTATPAGGSAQTTTITVNLN